MATFRSEEQMVIVALWTERERLSCSLRNKFTSDQDSASEVEQWTNVDKQERNADVEKRTEELVVFPKESTNPVGFLPKRKSRGLYSPTVHTT